MDGISWSPEAEAAIEAAKAAGAVALAKFKQEHAVRWKGARDIVTEVDVAAEKEILAVLQERFPEDAILSEEAGWAAGSKERVWVVDPLDGTTNYSIHNPLFAASVAFCTRQPDGTYAVKCGAVFSPVSGELFAAEAGKGAWLSAGKGFERLRVNRDLELAKGIVTYCRGNADPERARIVRLFSALTPVTRDFKRMGAGTLELSFVAAGRTLAHLSGKGKPWDAAAGQLLVCEAGGRVTDFLGKEWSLDLAKAEQDILASNAVIHEELLRLLQRAQATRS
ncbi:MAG TPA: inositol monophosphatase [archaeon]|nr:inositol monophosphatase [archaeon]